MVSGRDGEKTDDHVDMGKLKYEHFLLDIADAILPSLDGGEFASFQYIKENFMIGSISTISIGKPQLPHKSNWTLTPAAPPTIF